MTSLYQIQTLDVLPIFLMFSEGTEKHFSDVTIEPPYSVCSFATKKCKLLMAGRRLQSAL